MSHDCWSKKGCCGIWERFTSLAFRGEQICFTLQMLSPLYDGGGDETRISTWERQLARTGWVPRVGVPPGFVAV